MDVYKIMEDAHIEVQKEQKRIYDKEYRKNNKDKIKQYHKKYREENKEKLKNYIKKYSEIHKKSLKLKNIKYYEENKNRISQYKKDYRLKNKEKIREKKAKYDNENKEKKKLRAERYKTRRNEKRRERLKTDENYKLHQRLRNRIWASLKTNGIKKAKRTIELLGITIEELKKYLESKFKPGMTWDNYGYGDDKWHIDHIIPCDFFDFTDPKQQESCFHYTNLQPLWQKENLLKSNKIFNN
jgi:hypothetical protein